MQRCRDIETKYPLPPSTWHKCHQYSVAPRVMQSMKTAWTFGIGKEARHEGWLRYFIADLDVRCFDPTKMSERTIATENWTVMQRDNEKGWSDKPKLKWFNVAFHPSQTPLTFYTIDPKRRCYSLVNHDPENVVHSYTVSTRNIKGLLKDNPIPDYVKFDVEGLWYEFCNEILENNLPVKQIVGEFEMYMGDEDTQFQRLNTIIQLFEEAGFKVFTNRRLNTAMVELAFVKKEYV